MTVLYDHQTFVNQKFGEGNRYFNELIASWGTGYSGKKNKHLEFVQICFNIAHEKILFNPVYYGNYPIMNTSEAIKEPVLTDPTEPEQWTEVIEPRTRLFSLGLLGYSVAFTAIILFAGVVVFNRVEKSFMDTV